MSKFLLQKSSKLFEDSNPIKKAKKSTLQKLKKKKNWTSVKNISKTLSEENILQNLEKIKQLNNQNSVDETQKVLQNHIVLSKNKRSNVENNKKEKEEESTVFSEKDFEEFEREYLNS
ncbi:conserved hypothetical protein [Pediculus humanus corporis]|uniref:Uncharacterized protein n=1 Tax=Pediculus humanus subsp. corporis TaxID=121224 RepID=E0VD58_PEDHC|nr:uncharacterized protein Phum_PHUM105910 [Pediculus humanus corporis]EEB11314.1 conserved hypothetical protein [Pediculus humanus corporis]